MKKLVFIITLVVFALSVSLLKVSPVYAATGDGLNHDMKPMFNSPSNMTTKELVAEMKYAIKMRDAGKYYPQDRLKSIEKQMAVNQQKEIDRYKDQLKKEAEVAKKIEEIKEAVIEKAKEKGEEWYEEHEEEIQKQVENQARKMLGMTETEWIVNKDMFTEVYNNGAEAYEEHLKGPVETAQTALNAYNAYNEAKEKFPEAPETAQKLLGFLGATKEVLSFAGDKMEDTPLRPFGEIIKAYGEAAGLGDSAAKAAWECIHKGDINPNFKTQYTDGLDQIGLADYGPVTKTDLMKFDKDLKILDLGDGRFAVFDENFKPIPGSTGLALTAAEFNKLQELYVAYENGKKEDWPKLTPEQLVQLAKGEKITVKTEDNWFKDKFQDFDPNGIMDLGHRNMNKVLDEEIRRSIDRIVNGDQGILDKLVDPFTRTGRMRDINEAYGKYLETLDSTLDKSSIDLMEGFMEWVKKMKDANPNMTMEDIKKKLQEEIDKKKGLADKEKTEDDKDKDKGKTNPVKDKIKKLDPKVKDATAGGLVKDKKPIIGKPAKPSIDPNEHWSGNTPDSFNGKTDSGFAQIGTTNRPLPDTNKLAIPVLKPNIYLYPSITQIVEVSFANPEKLTITIPKYSKGWTVTATPDGKIFNKLPDNTEKTRRVVDKYDYLFYEANVEEKYFQTSAAWKLPVKGRTDALENILDLYGFNEKEKADFIAFWSEKLDSNKKYLIYPQETALINRAMPIKIGSTPDSLYRIWFYFISGEDEPILIPHNVERIKRTGFTVVEWGGMFK